MHNSLYGEYTFNILAILLSESNLRISAEKFYSWL